MNLRKLNSLISSIRNCEFGIHIIIKYQIAILSSNHTIYLVLSQTVPGHTHTQSNTILVSTNICDYYTIGTHIKHTFQFTGTNPDYIQQ